MLDVKSLERRWFKYKLKSILPYFFAFLIISLISSAILLWLNYNPHTVQKQMLKQEKKVTIQKPIQQVSLTNTELNTTILEPSMEFVQSFQNTLEPIEQPKQSEVITKKPIRHLPISSTTLTSPEYMPKQQLIPPPQSKLIPRDASFSINRAESKFNINDLQQRFKETSNANLGLFIARYYYDRGEYSEAYNYALKTNSINNKVDESWIIFSKSLVKLGRVDQAKKTLQLYISQSNSEAAHNLLDSIEKGNFK